MDRGFNVANGTIIDGKFRIERRIDRGGFASVYEATQLSFERRVALKLLDPERAAKTKEEARFRAEARAARDLQHRNIVTIFDYGVDEDLGTPYLAMDLIRGETLASYVQNKGPLPVEEAVSIVRQITSAVVEAHAHRVVHRDLKPRNIMISQDTAGERCVHVLDFGIAKRLDGQPDPGWTTEGVAIGSPKYMSPEQARGTAVDARSDLYSLGCVLHFLLTGHPPFDGDTTQALLHRHTLESPPEIPSSAGANEGLRRLHRMLLEKHPDRRPLNARVVLGMLDDAPTLTHGSSPAPVHEAEPTRPTPAIVDSATTDTSSETPSVRSARPVWGGPAWVATFGLLIFVFTYVFVTRSLEPAGAKPNALAEGVTWSSYRPARFVEVVRVTIVSNPTGANVLMNGTDRGATPLHLQLDKQAEPQTLVFVKTGYRNATIHVKLDRTRRISVRLDKLRSRAEQRGLSTRR